MAQHPIELILTRQLGTQLALPVFLIDHDATMVFYNEAAEVVLGRRFEETATMTAAEWAAIFAPRNAAGEPVSPDALPLMIALRQKRPIHEALLIRGLDGIDRRIEITAFPVIGITGRLAGALAIFWESACA
jgi:PAS domain-containing protein